MKAYLISIQEQIKMLTPLIQKLNSTPQLQEKLNILNTVNEVVTFLEDAPLLKKFLSGADLQNKYLLNSLIALGQGPYILNIRDLESPTLEKLETLCQNLWNLEVFYSKLGGVIGYHYTVISLIEENRAPLPPCSNTDFLQPEGLNISEKDELTKQAIIDGIANLPQIAEIYPVGGAGDRLQLMEPTSQTPLPAARLLFSGKSLLEGLITDLQVREYLHYKIYGRQLTTPLAMMTSHEKDNDTHIKSICEESHWFGRPKGSFKFFVQSTVPVITEEGYWSQHAPLELFLKPGGHGMIWKLAKDQGIFSWLYSQGYSKALVRQINNPIAGLDYSLLAFTGLGYANNKKFGFASCFRLVGASEGSNILSQTKTEEGYRYCISNVEYTDFAKNNIQDKAAFFNSQYSPYPSNTNILFVDLKTIDDLSDTHPTPGMLINMKNMVPFYDTEGNKRELKGGRLESTMQNIADYITDTCPQILPSGERNSLKTYLTFNHRHKTISVTKRAYKEGGSIEETPQCCFYDLQCNHHELFQEHCSFTLPDLVDIETYQEKGPGTLIMYHPALGPIYDIIRQKVSKSILQKGSEMQLNISDCYIRNLDLDGSLCIHADNIVGDISEDLLHYSNMTGKCHLENVKVKNQGIDQSADNIFWKNKVSRIESLSITLRGNGEFQACDITFNGNFTITVPNGVCMTAKQNEDGSITFSEEAISSPTWSWDYCVNADNDIILQKTKRSLAF